MIRVAAGYYGGQISAPVFASIAHEILEERHPELLPEPKVEEAPADTSKKKTEKDSVVKEEFSYDTLKFANVPRVTMPNVLGLPLRAVAERMQNAGLLVNWSATA